MVRNHHFHPSILKTGWLFGTRWEPQEILPKHGWKKTSSRTQMLRMYGLCRGIFTYMKGEKWPHYLPTLRLYNNSSCTVAGIYFRPCIGPHKSICNRLAFGYHPVHYSQLILYIARKDHLPEFFTIQNRLTTNPRSGPPRVEWQSVG